MLVPRPQQPPDKMIPNILNHLILLSLLANTASQRRERSTRVWSQEERSGVPLFARHVAHAVDCGGEDAVGVALEELTDVADEGAGDGGGRDPLTVCVQDFEAWDAVLPDESNPCTKSE